jgi:hypothetical protein
MAAIHYWMGVVVEARRFLEANQDLTPAGYVGLVNGFGGPFHFAAHLGATDDWDDFVFLLVLYWECHRLCDLARGDVPYNPIIRLQ